MERFCLLLVLLALGALVARGGAEPALQRLFPPSLPTATWTEFSSPGYKAPVTGLIYRARELRPVCGVPLGALATGCLDIEASGALGYSSIFNDQSPRGGPVNMPFLGLSVGDRTWVLCTGQIKHYDAGNIPPLPDPRVVVIGEGEGRLLARYDTHWQNLGEALAVDEDQFPVVFRTSVDQLIFKAGDFGGHTPALSPASTYSDYSWVKWTAPVAATVRLRGGAWSNFDGRTCDFALRHNGRDLFGGFADGVLGRLTLGADFTSENPLTFDLPEVEVAQGDELLFAFRTNGTSQHPDMGTFFGLRAEVLGPDRIGEDPVFGRLPSADWVLARDFRPQINPDGAWSYGSTQVTSVPPPADLNFDGCQQATEIEYWGHYPVLDLEFKTSAPVEVGARLWSPLLPGDTPTSNTPGALFEVHLRNVSNEPQQGRLLFSFPGFREHQSKNRATGFPNLAAVPSLPPSQLQRTTLDEPGLTGVTVSDPGWKVAYSLGAINEPSTESGACLLAEGERWAEAATGLRAPLFSEDGTALAVPYELPAGAERVVRFVLAWYAPDWNGNGTPGTGGESYTHMYASRYTGAADVARFLAANHETLLARILNWQQVLYSAPELPGWLADSLINNLYLLPETSTWAQAKPPIGDWCRLEDGIYAHNESPRSCPQTPCLPCDAISGMVPMVYFYPETVRALARTWKAYQLPSGQMKFNFGLYWDLTHPMAEGNQEVMNGANYLVILDRYYLLTQDEDFLREFYDSAKRACQFSFSQRPAYGLDQIVAMPAPVEGSYNYREWFEDREWKGYVVHPGGYRMAQAQMMKRWALAVGDVDYVTELDQLLEAGARALEEQLWNGRFYAASSEPETGFKQDFWFSIQLNGQLYARSAGLPGVFPPERIQSVLDCVPKVASISKLGIPPTLANADFTPFLREKYDNTVIGAGYLSGAYNYTTHLEYQLAQTCMYEGRKELGLDLLKRTLEVSACTWGNTWEAWNACSVKADDGSRGYGMDYFHNLCLWNTPAALMGQDLAGPARPGGLIQRLLQAAKAP